MNRTLLIAALLATLGLAACEKQPVVVNVPATPVAVPGPAGPQGAAGTEGSKGATGVQGETGKTGQPGGEGSTVIVVPPAPAPEK